MTKGEAQQRNISAYFTTKRSASTGAYNKDNKHSSTTSNNSAGKQGARPTKRARTGVACDTSGVVNTPSTSLPQHGQPAARPRAREQDSDVIELLDSPPCSQPAAAPEDPSPSPAHARVHAVDDVSMQVAAKPLQGASAAERGDHRPSAVLNQDVRSSPVQAGSLQQALSGSNIPLPVWLQQSASSIPSSNHPIGITAPGGSTSTVVPNRGMGHTVRQQGMLAQQQRVPVLGAAERAARRFKLAQVRMMQDVIRHASMHGAPKMHRKRKNKKTRTPCLNMCISTPMQRGHPQHHVFKSLASSTQRVMSRCSTSRASCVRC